MNERGVRGERGGPVCLRHVPRVELDVSKIKTEILTQTLTEVEIERQLQRVSAVEERALRMRNGWALSPDRPIQFARPEAVETQIMLAELEMSVWRHVHTDPECVADNDIISELSNL